MIFPHRFSRCPPRLLAFLLLALATGTGLTISARAEEPQNRPQFIDIRVLPPDRPGGESAAARGAGRPAPARVPVNPALKGLTTIDQARGRVTYRKGYVLGVGIHVIEANMRDPQVKIAPMLAEGGIGTTEAFDRMMSRAQPIAAITGTFFGLRNRLPTGDLVINGETAWRGFIGTAVAITPANSVAFVPTRYKDQSVDWRPYETVIRGGPSLIYCREITVAPREEGFYSLGASARHMRTAVGLTKENHLLLVAVRQSITLWELAKVMYQLGAWDAVALDGGTSTAMYYGGKTRIHPGRSMTNVLLIYADSASFEARRPQLGGPPSSQAAPALRVSSPSTSAASRGSGFEPALPDPALPRSDAFRLDIRIEPARPKATPGG